VPTAVLPEAISQISEKEQQAVDKEQLTSAHTNLQFFNSVLSPIPGVSFSQQQAVSRVVSKIGRSRITADQWVWPYTPSSSGLQVGTAGNPSPEVAATNSGYQEPSPDRGGGAEANGQGCSKDGHPPCRSISQ